jgi:hypothetical protein
MSEKFPSQLAERFQVRMPDGLRDQIRRHAEFNNRSMNAEIIYLLENALWNEDRYRIEDGLEPFGPVSGEERERIELRLEDRARRAAERIRAMSAHGVDDILSEVVSRLARLENKIEEWRTDGRLDSSEK